RQTRSLGNRADRVPRRLARPDLPAVTTLAPETAAPAAEHIREGGEMTGKSDFSEEEWQEIVEGPPTARMILLTADRGGTFRETFALARAYTDARRQHAESELLDELVAAKPEFDRHRYKTTGELRDRGLEQLGKAVALLRDKATPEETEAYRKF